MLEEEESRLNLRCFEDSNRLVVVSRCSGLDLFSIMSKIVIYNASILTLDDDDTFYYPGTIEIDGDRISKVYGGDPSNELRTSDQSITFLDGTDKLVMPGLVALHFHTSVAKVDNNSPDPIRVMC